MFNSTTNFKKNKKDQNIRKDRFSIISIVKDITTTKTKFFSHQVGQ